MSDLLEGKDIVLEWLLAIWENIDMEDMGGNHVDVVGSRRH